jgi:hypothetical protein
MRLRLVYVRALLVAAALAPALSGVAPAQDAAAFYRGKTINLIVGFNPGGGADAYTRLLARHLGRHIAGNPTIVVRNMQGAGSVIAANYIFNVSPKDGLEIGLFAGNIVIDPLIGGTQHKYDAPAFNWIGAPSSDSNVCVASPLTLNNVIGTKFKLVKGYAGSAAMRLALERGEIEGFCGVGYYSMRTAGLLTPDKANVLVQIGLSKHPEMPNVPFVFDYAKSEEDRQIFTLVFGWLDLVRPIAAPPGTPAERVQALRDGFDRAMKDPALLADADKIDVGIKPMTGAAIAKFVDDASRTPPAVTARAARILGRVK